MLAASRVCTGVMEFHSNQEVALVEKKKRASQTWMLLDTNGNTISLELDKYAIMQRAGIHARDLRILDPLLFYPSAILGRERAIVLNLEHIKAIITAEEVLLRDPANELVIPLVEELSRRLPVQESDNLGHDRLEAEGGDLDVQSARWSDQQGEHDDKIPENDELTTRTLNMLMYPKQSTDEKQPRNSMLSGCDAKQGVVFSCNVKSGVYYVPPFEFRGLEVVLESICSFLDTRSIELESSTRPALEELTRKISSRNLDHVRKLKSSMTRLTARVHKVRDELGQLLGDDDDMADFFLTRKLFGASSPYPSFRAPTIATSLNRGAATSTNSAGDVDELEMLLEACFTQIDGTLNKLTTLREFIDDTEDYINIQLDNCRNKLIQLDLILSSATVVVTLFSLVAGIFGMNVPYKWNHYHPEAFTWVVALTGSACVVIFTTMMGYARHKQLIEI